MLDCASATGPCRNNGAIVDCIERCVANSSCDDYSACVLGCRC
jgi:hypothetical protein